MWKLLLLLLLLSNSIFAQTRKEKLSFKVSGYQIERKCKSYFELKQEIPSEVGYAIDVVDGYIAVYFSDKTYFNQIFEKPSDGIAIEIVHRDNYKCEEDSKVKSNDVQETTILPAIFLKELRKKIKPINKGYLLFQYAPLPKNVSLDEGEFNLLIIQRKYLCENTVFYNIDRTHWELLEMGLYRDSLPNLTTQLKSQYSIKRLKYTIPFQKNKTDYNQKYIKPLYDSLNFTDYNIKEIYINAFTSVEGDLEKNIQIQKARAASMVSALQDFQQPQIISHVNAQENWQGFQNDIRNTPFKYLLKYSKVEVKEILQDQETATKLEPILKNHRKAEIEIVLQKKTSFFLQDSVQLKAYFKQIISQKKIKEALYLQELILDRIRNEELPDSFINRLEVPETSEFGPIHNNFAIFIYEHENPDLLQNIANFERLQTLFPHDLKIKYNLTALKIKAWPAQLLPISQIEIEKAISDLEQGGIDKSLIKRLWVNYNIILTELNHEYKDYDRKNDALTEVFQQYKNLQLSDEDLLNLAKYLSFFDKMDWAKYVLRKRVEADDASAEVIFYALNLWVYDIHKNRKFQQLSERASILNQQKFCDLFLSNSQGGISFQLLEDDFLKNLYCQKCNSSN